MRLLHLFRLFAAGVLLCFLHNVKVVGMKPDPDPSEAWKLKFASSINWQRITPIGNLVVCTSDGLYGVDPEKGRITWQIKRLGNIPYHSYRVLPNTFYVQISLNNQVIILDPYEGQIISDTKKAGFKSVLAKNILFESSTVLICGYKDKPNASFSLFDIATGRELWNNGKFFEGSKGLKSFSNSLKTPSDIAPGQSIHTFELIESDGQGFILASNNHIFNINTQTGQIIWKADLPELPEEINNSGKPTLVKSVSGNYFYYVKPGFMMGYDVSNGQQLWPEVIGRNEFGSEIISHQLGLIILPKSDQRSDTINNLQIPHIHLLDYHTGETLWGKKYFWRKTANGIKIPGSVTNFAYVDDHIILMMSNGDMSYLNILDTANGCLKFENSLKVQGTLEYTEVTNSGLLYITENTKTTNGEINIFDLQNGQPKLPKSIQSGKSMNNTRYKSDRFNLLRVFKDNFLYVFSGKDQTLYEVNLDNARLRVIRENIVFQGNETPTNLEVRSKGLLLHSKQNISLIGFDGRTKFQKYYPAPNHPGILKALHATDAVYRALCRARKPFLSAPHLKPEAHSNIESYEKKTIPKGLTSPNQKQNARTYSPATLTAAKQRVKASMISSGFIFMIINLEKQNQDSVGTPEPQNYGLVRVSKDTGEVIEKINLKGGKEPNYQVDGILNSIYYRQNPKEIVSYKFQE